ncbi:SpoIID/LytB domain-containing protein [Thermaerobacter composti]|uniref:SpoIID/LytB domain-containing protein n=1 Tax=Thermaerobacter composti TaxID=554949 RepID=A0ABZ0QQ94_9FIRM|nr:SpoIID/LytB domain-containing protein [Thermaerobacter composti]WPD19665.1 SpoIID/LytB domain-containing protein [Thermaerobacter composti]
MRVRRAWLGTFALVLCVTLTVGVGGAMQATSGGSKIRTSEPMIVEVNGLFRDENGRWTLDRREGVMRIELPHEGAVLKVTVPAHGPQLLVSDDYRLVVEDVARDGIRYAIHALAAGYPSMTNGTVQTGQHVVTLTVIGVQGETTHPYITDLRIDDRSGQPAWTGGFNLQSTGTSSPVLVIPGGGWGHRVGMSQYGAQGLALLGVRYDQILAHYYPGTKIEKRYDDAKQQVEVDLANGGRVAEPRNDWVIQLVKASQMSGNAGGTPITLPDGVYRIAFNSKDGKFIITDLGGSGATRAVPGSELVVQTPADAYVGVWYKKQYRNGSEPDYKYEGRMVFRKTDDNKLTAHNQLPLGRYLMGVVPYEMPASWAAHALMAQTIAARTFAALHNFGVKTATKDNVLVDSTFAQVYNGKYENAKYAEKIAKVIGDTKGQVLMAGGLPASAVYSSSNGGWIESNVAGFGSSNEESYLTGRPDIFRLSVEGKVIPIIPENYMVGEKKFSATNHRWYDTAWSVTAIRKKWPQIGSFRSIHVLERSAGKGVRSIRIDGSTGCVVIMDHGGSPPTGSERCDKVTYTSIRSAAGLGLKSTLIYGRRLRVPDLADIEGHWAEESIRLLAGAGVIEGYRDGTFRPDRSLTRAEFVTLVNEAGGLAPAKYSGTFKDVRTDDWYAGQVAAAVKAGYIKGYPDGTFKPDRKITRNEMAVALAKAMQLPAGGSLTFKDRDAIPAWARSSVAAAVAAGYLSGYPDGTFRGNHSATRAEMATIVDRAWNRLWVFLN